MLDQPLKEKLINTTFLARLTTGELLIGVVIMQESGGISLFFPYEIKNDELELFCPYAKNRRFEVAPENFQFVKTPNDAILDRYFVKMISAQFSEFADFIKYFSRITSAQEETLTFPESNETEAKTERVLH